jgi:hypothetical protein
MDLCISCGKHEVGWPRVCEECKDHEAQAILASEDAPECGSCGMRYDGGMRCTYCGDSDPTDSGEE